MIQLDELSKLPSAKKAGVALFGVFALSWIIVICGIVFSNLPINNAPVGATIGTGTFISIVVPSFFGYMWILLRKLYP